MAANTAPIYSIVGKVQSSLTTAMAPTILTATGDYTGVSTNALLVLTSGANGSLVSRLRFKAVGTNIATVARIYFNNGSTQATATNNSFFGEVSLPAVTASNTTATAEIDYPLNVALPASFRIYVGVATTVASGWAVTPVAGDY